MKTLVLLAFAGHVKYEVFYLSQIHIVNVSPHCLQRYVGRGVICNNGSDFIDILHSISALVKTKPPIRHHGGLTNHIAVLPRDVDRARASKDVEIDHPANHVVFEILPSGIAVDLKIHAIAVQHENPVSITTALTILEVDWVVPVEVSSRRDQVRISRPQGASIVGRWPFEWIGVFSKSIDIGTIWKRSA